MMTLLRCWCGFNTINKKRIYRKRETGAGNCIPGRLSPFEIMMWPPARWQTTTHRFIILQAPCVPYRQTS